jgi:hypothetical protein
MDAASGGLNPTAFCRGTKRWSLPSVTAGEWLSAEAGLSRLAEGFDGFRL